MIRNRVLEALHRRIMRAYNDKKSFRVVVVIPLLPGFQVLIFYPVSTQLCFSMNFGLTFILSTRGGLMIVAQHL